LNNKGQRKKLKLKTYNKMKKLRILYILTFASLLMTYSGYGQSDSLLRFCAKNMGKQFISDGQQYFSLLNGPEIAEFRATFFAGATYRIAACSGLIEGNLIFTLYDSTDPQKRREIFSNKNYKNTPYWDFKFVSTMECVIEAQLDTKSPGPGSGFAILLIGFKK
jgi:hypothetical protein